jgi:hypothetical protein
MRPLPIVALATTLLAGASPVSAHPRSGVLRQPLAGAAAAKKLAGGAVYGGTTSQGEPLVAQLSRDGKRIGRLAFDMQTQCTSGSHFHFAGAAVPGKAKIKPNGRFTALVTGRLDGGDETGLAAVTLKGKLSAGKASGSISGNVTWVNNQTQAQTDSCSSNADSWRAKSARGRVYGGMTSEFEPVVVELARNGRKVSDLRLSWTTTCASQMTLHVPDDLTDFPISSGGGFGDNFGMDATQQDGTKVHVDYQVDGKVGKRRATGHFHAVATFTDPAGAVDTCASSSMSWIATS